MRAASAASGLEVATMDIASITTSPRIASWMVDLLFGQASQAESAPPSPTVATQAVTVPSSAKPPVAAATGRAIANLPPGGGSPSSEAGGSQPLTVREMNAQVAANDRLTSAQISDALYRGTGLPIGNTSDTFAANIQRWQMHADWIATLASQPQQTAPGDSPYHPDRFDQKLQGYIDSMQNAFDRHAITFMKLSDIPNIACTEHAVVSGPDQDGAPTSASWTGGHNQQALDAFNAVFTPGEHGSLCSYGGIMIMATWIDNSFQE